MADPAKMPTHELRDMRDYGALIYCGAYVRLMAKELGIDTSDTEGINRMVLQMVEPMKHATEAIWRALMEDHIGKEEALIRFRKALLNV